jgi:hypothetical protein
MLLSGVFISIKTFLEPFHDFPCFFIAFENRSLENLGRTMHLIFPNLENKPGYFFKMKQ